MFSCCFPTSGGSSGGSGPRKGRNRGIGHCWRRWVRPLLLRICPCFRGGEKDEAETDLNELELSGLKSNSIDYVENLVGYLETAIQNENYLVISTFLGIYPKYMTTWQVLDLLMKRNGSFQPDCEEDQLSKNAICFFLEFWMANFPEDFCESPDLAVLKQLMDYVMLNMPSSDLVMDIQKLLTRLLEEQGSKKAETQDEDASDSGPSSTACLELQPEDASEMPEILELGEASAEEPQEEPSPQEDPVSPVIMKVPEEDAEPPGVVQDPEEDPESPVMMEPSLSAEELAPLPAEDLEQAVLTVADEETPPEEVAADLPPTKQAFTSAAWSSEPQNVCPLPEVDI